MALCVIAFCWAHKTGQWRHQLKPLKIKKHGELEKSLIRADSWDTIRDRAKQLVEKVESLKAVKSS
jgi:hypothetical protein